MFTNPGYNGIYCNLRPCAAAQKINEVKNMFLSVILTIAAAYMALQCGLTAFSVPFASWTWLSWLYLAMAAVMIGVCVVSARRAVRAYKKQAEKIKEEQARELEKLHAKRRALYLDEDIDLRPRPRRPKPRAWPPRRRRPQEQTRRTAARTAGKAAKPPKRRTAATIDPRRARQRDALSGRNCLAYPAPPCAQ